MPKNSNFVQSFLLSLSEKAKRKIGIIDKHKETENIQFVEPQYKTPQSTEAHQNIDRVSWFTDIVNKFKPPLQRLSGYSFA